MDIHHAMVVHTQPERLCEALTQPHDLQVWMGAPTLGRPEVGTVLEFRFDQGQRILKLEIIRLDVGKLVQWRVLQPVWPIDATDQIVSWTLSPFEGSTLVDFRMQGWPQDDDVYASVSYKWASFMMRLKIYMGDTREIDNFPPLETKHTTNVRDT
jgi:uncharacterized protein YndB with AHSA1/START domain